MELLFRYGGLRGPELGELFGVSYSAVSWVRKRLRENKKIDEKIEELERRLSFTVNNKD